VEDSLNNGSYSLYFCIQYHSFGVDIFPWECYHTIVNREAWTERFVGFRIGREMAVGASHDVVRLNVAPEPERRKRKPVDLSRISHVSAVNEWYPL
jgi:hypothetical protein